MRTPRARIIRTGDQVSLELAAQDHERRRAHRHARHQARLEFRTEAGGEHRRHQQQQGFIDLLQIAMRDAVIGDQPPQPRQRMRIEPEQPVRIGRIGKHRAEQGGQVAPGRRPRQQQARHALPQFAKESRCAWHAGIGKQFRTDRFAQRLLDRGLNQPAHIAMRIQPVQQVTGALMAGAAPGAVVTQRRARLVAQPFGDIGHPVGALLPACKWIGPAHQHFDLGCILQMPLRRRSATEPAPNGPGAQKKNLHHNP
jgi:hypothetical protein